MYFAFLKIFDIKATIIYVSFVLKSAGGLAGGTLRKKCSFPLRISSLNVFPEDLVTFTEEIHNGKLHFLCSRNPSKSLFIVPDNELLLKTPPSLIRPLHPTLT